MKKFFIKLIKWISMVFFAPIRWIRKRVPMSIKGFLGLAKWIFGLLAAVLSPPFFYWFNTGEPPHVFEETLSFLENAGVKNIWFWRGFFVSILVGFAIVSSSIRFYFLRTKKILKPWLWVLIIVLTSGLWLALNFFIPDQHSGWFLLVVAIISLIVSFVNTSQYEKEVAQYLAKRMAQNIKKDLSEESSDEFVNSLNWESFDDVELGLEELEKRRDQSLVKKHAKVLKSKIIEEDDEYFQVELPKDGVWGEGKIIIRKSDKSFSAVDILWVDRAEVTYKYPVERYYEIRNRKMLKDLHKAGKETQEALVGLVEFLAEKEKVSKKTLEKILRQLKELKELKAPRKKSSPRKRGGKS